jgi:peptide chain release factor 1
VLEVDIVIRPEDIKMETMRAGGAGGQHVNKTDSAVRLTHIPSGTVVECEEERSQHMNRAKALRILRTRLYDREFSRLQGERVALRRSMIGSGSRSERIRTYNFPQSRITDHRLGASVHSIADYMAGGAAVDELFEPLADRELRIRAGSELERLLVESRQVRRTLAAPK